MKIIFFAPRFHTNQSQIIKGLIKKYKICFHSIYKGKTEDYSLIKPKIIQQSYVSLILQNIFGVKNKFLIFFPNIKKYFLLLKRENPDYIIIRVYGKVYPYVIGLISKILKIKIIFYDQYFINLKHLKKKNIINYLKKIEIYFRCFFFKSIIYSPIKSKQIFKNIYYLPFVANVKKNVKLKKNSKARILIISKYQSRKNLIYSFDVIESLLAKYNFNITYVGEVSNYEHKKIYNLLIKKKTKSIHKNKFEILKNINFNKMPNIYKKHDIFLLPANNEPASVSILEAMAHGLVVICSDTCATSSYLPIIRNNIFKSNNKRSLKKCLEFYLENYVDILKYKTINYNYCLNNFTFKHYHQKLLKIFKFYEKK